MDIKRIVIQAAVAALLFTVISVILENDFSQEVWLEKGTNGLIFAVLYGLFLTIRDRFFKKKE